jgi:HAD superfamily hydrolase (TIGR01509 family)
MLSNISKMRPTLYFLDPQIDALIRASDAIVFDLSGLLVDDEPIQLQATNHALAPYGVTLSAKEWIEKCVGHKPSEYLSSLVPTSSSADIARLIQYKDTIYEKLIAGKAKKLVRPGALSLLRYARISKRRMALATSTTRTGATMILGENGLNVWNSFNLVVTGDDVGRAKPDPEIYNRVRSQLGDALVYLVFEDSSSGVASAKGAGMSCIAVPNRFTANQNLAMADLVITSLDSEACVCR